MFQNEKKEKPDLIDNLLAAWRALKLIVYDPLYEIYLGFETGALPATLCWSVGSVLSLLIFFYVDSRILAHFGKRSLGPGRFREILGITAVFWGFLFWGYYRLGMRMRRIRKLDHMFINAHIETRLKERPEFISDLPIDDFTRRLRLRGRGIPASTYISAKAIIESELNVYVTKIEYPENNREIVDVIYTTHELPDFWSLDGIVGYRDFTFPVGKGHRGEIKASLIALPHYLIAGETGGGKSSFIRMMLTILLANNADMEVYFLDFKEGMENQVFHGFDNIKLVDNVPDAGATMILLKELMEKRMKNFKAAGARNLEMYNKMQSRSADIEKRIVVVIDEISELVPRIGGTQNSTLNDINSTLNRIARMGRAVGINLVIGTQKPDAKNLDPTIKANLSGIMCFPVTHFSQSTVILGNARAAELNAAIPGRAIWKIGSNQEEVQTPFLTETEVSDARARAAKFWGAKPKDAPISAEDKKETPPAERFGRGSGTSQIPLAVESAQLSTRESDGV